MRCATSRIPVAFSLLSLSLPSALTAQSTVVLPATAAAQEQPGSLPVPWNGVAPQSQSIYHASMFIAAGIDHPITITGMRWRADGGYARGQSATLQATIALASTPVAPPHWYWADNRGDDFAVVHNGAVTIAPTTGTSPNQWAVASPITPFVYDPFTGGHLLVEVACSGAASVPLDAASAPTTGTLHTLTPNPQQASVYTPRVPVLELTYTPTFPLLARFATTSTAGPSPLQVTFTDRSFCADPAGIQSWRWDLDGDGLVDSTLQNPTFTYATCGDFTATLTVTDAQNRTHTAAPVPITVDPLQAGFYASPVFGNAPLTVTFTDTSLPTPNVWAWDFDGDGVPESTAPNPTWTFAAGLHEVRLTVVYGCRASTVTHNVAAGRVLQGPTTLPGVGMAVGSLMMMDVQVNAPDGIDLLGFDTNMPGCCAPQARLWVMVTPGSYVGAANDSSLWRIGASGVAVAYQNRVVFDRPLHLAQGGFGLALGMTAPPGTQALIVYTANPSTFGNNDLTVASGLYQVAAFSGGIAAGLDGSFVYTRSGLDLTGGFGFFAAGCPTTAGPSHIASSDGFGPRLGRTLVTELSNVPVSSPGIFAVIGLDRSSTVLGPLPLDLSPYGMPGCQLHVRDDVVRFHGGATSFSMAIPNAPYLLGLGFYQQAVILDPLLNNAARAAISDAAAAVIGL